ncbi:MAG TPA: hypothetical protein VF300_01740, partial [Methanothrix sp.]
MVTLFEESSLHVQDPGLQMRQPATLISRDSSKADLLLLATTVLKIMNETRECEKFVREILLAIKQATGFEAAGIWL